tara:strand:+ start:279 stop:530 length:252 start_codon:yes stop_codon:yes gene_type:complete
MPIRIKPKFLSNPIKKFFDIRELKTRYKQRKIINFTVLLYKNLYSLLYKIKNINEKSINKMLAKEIDGPTIMVIGIKENNIQK